MRNIFWAFLLVAALARIDSAHAQQPVKLPDHVLKAIDKLNEDYRQLAEAACGLRQTDIPPDQEVMSLEQEIKNSIGAITAMDSEWAEFNKKHSQMIAKSAEEARANKAESDRIFELARKGVMEQIEKLIVRKPKVACPTPGTTVQPPQPAGCKTCAALDAEIKKLDAEYKAMDGKSGDAVIARRHQIDAQITKLEGEKTSCEKVCKAPPPTKKAKHSAPSSRRDKGPVTQKKGEQPNNDAVIRFGIDVGTDLLLRRERERDREREYRR